MSDYYPFGMEMPGRNWSLKEYMWGFQGSEKVDEIKGYGNIYTTMFRELDPRLGGRWWSIDPILKSHESPYVWNTNNPILFIDIFGADSTQRANAIVLAKKYVTKNPGNSYSLGAKGEPGESVDCSGIISACLFAGGEADPITNPDAVSKAKELSGKANGVARIASMTTKISDNKKLQPGMLIVLDNSKTGTTNPFGHIGIITEIQLNDNGEIITLKFIDSGGSIGPRNSVAIENGIKKYWGKRITGFYKWDTKPDIEKPRNTAVNVKHDFNIPTSIENKVFNNKTQNFILSSWFDKMMRGLNNFTHE